MQKLIPYRLKSKWGYCDETKKIIIPAIFSQTFPHVHGIGKVKNDYEYINLENVPTYFPNSAFGFVNEKRIIKEAIFYRVIDFQEEVAAVQLYNDFTLEYYNHELGWWTNEPSYSEDDIRTQSRIDLL